MTALFNLFTDADNSNPIPIRTQRVTEAINNQRRRAVLVELDSNDTPITLSELAERIAADEFDCHRDLLAAQERKRVYVSLYQLHLDRLHEMGAIAWDQESNEVSTTNATAPMAELVREIEARTLTIEQKSDN